MLSKLPEGDPEVLVLRQRLKEVTEKRRQEEEEEEAAAMLAAADVSQTVEDFAVALTPDTLATTAIPLTVAAAPGASFINVRAAATSSRLPDKAALGGFSSEVMELDSANANS